MVGSNEMPRPFSSGDNSQIAKTHLRNLKTCFSRATKVMSPKPGTKNPRKWAAGMQWIQFCSNEGPQPFLRVDDNQIAKIH